MVLLITGTTGIAAATADLARERGATIFTTGLEPPADLVADLREPDATGRAVRMCVERHGRLDALLACAGASGRQWGDGPLHDCSDDGWLQTIDTNLTIAFRTCRAALRQMILQPEGGSIVAVGSVLAFSPESPRFSTHAYAAAKGGLWSMTRSIASYYAPHKIRANYLAPGLVRTPMTRRAQSDPELLEFAAAKQPLLGRMAEAEEVARAAWFLLSAESAAITGATLTVDGGWSIS